MKNSYPWPTWSVASVTLDVDGIPTHGFIGRKGCAYEDTKHFAPGRPWRLPIVDRFGCIALTTVGNEADAAICAERGFGALP